MWYVSDVDSLVDVRSDDGKYHQSVCSVGQAYISLCEIVVGAGGRGVGFGYVDESRDAENPFPWSCGYL